MRYFTLTASALILSLSACSNAASDPASKDGVPASTALPSTVSPSPISPSSISGDTALGNWAVDYEDSAIEFIGVQKGKSFAGAFTQYNAVINFDAADLDQAAVKVTIDASSVDAGDEERNESLPSKDWFNVKAFPHAVFETTDITLIDAASGAYEANGRLTIRDKTLAVTLPFTLDIDADHAHMQSTGFTIDRTDYGVGQGIWGKGEWVDKTVKININLNAKRR